MNDEIKCLDRTRQKENQTDGVWPYPKSHHGYKLDISTKCVIGNHTGNKKKQKSNDKPNEVLYPKR